VTGTAEKQDYSRAEVCRLANVTERQLKSWERQKLIEAYDSYGFKQLLALRTLSRLKAARRPPAQIRRALHALTQTLQGVHDPLTQLRLFVDGRKIRVEAEGAAMDAESGQLLLNFDAAELSRMLEFRVKPSQDAERGRRASAEQWFQKGLELEQTGAPAEQITDAYLKAIELDPNSAGALVNLGTVYFNTKRWKEAEQYYRQAIEADPNYALAHFDLANLYDERGDRAQALEHYQAALRVSPHYGDAHYNIALLYQGTNQPMKAVRHWSAYLKIDQSSQWADIARRELAKLRGATLLRGGIRTPTAVDE